MVNSGSTEQLRPSGFEDLASQSGPGLRVSRLPGRTGLAVAGEVDVATRHSWHRILAALLADDGPARLDVSGLSFIDSRGTAALVDVAQRMAPDRTLTLYRPPYCLRRVLDLFFSSEPITIEDEEAE